MNDGKRGLSPIVPLFNSNGTTSSNYNPGIGPVPSLIRNVWDDIWAPGAGGSSLGAFSTGTSVSPYSGSSSYLFNPNSIK